MKNDTKPEKNEGVIFEGNPSVKYRIIENGKTVSLYLQYFYGRVQVVDEATGDMKQKQIRKKENLYLTYLVNPKTPIERQQRKETKELAQKIRFEKEQEMKNDMLGYRLQSNMKKTNFLTFFQNYIDKYQKKDKRMMAMALRRFVDFLSNPETPEYNMYKECIKPNQITKDMITDFTYYLQSRSHGEGAHAVYDRFKKVMKYAVEHDIMIKNPCAGIAIKVDTEQLKKDVLSTDEIQQLINTHYINESKEIRRAFIFCCYTGLRFCDVRDLTYKNVDYSNMLLIFEQNKTKGHSANSGVVIPLNEGLISIIGKGEKDDVIFDLPTHESCLKSLRRWVKRAGIEKHITWHCARHSFAVNVLNNGANIKTLSSLLGHSSLKHTEKYTRAVDRLKEQAINSLPSIDLQTL